MSGLNKDIDNLTPHDGQRSLNPWSKWNRRQTGV